MVAAHLRITPLDSAITLAPQVLRDLIYAHALPTDGMEHVRVRAGPEGVDVLAFVDSDDPEAATEILHNVVRAAIRQEPLLRLWRII
ncbi:hypothetical protein [Micromonospora sp. NPDC005707]|uniref:hypothetical protein n=1 Tax=Micromonospora sp. NPDC005707 TaxID=3157050 RepID=UPI0034035444